MKVLRWVGVAIAVIGIAVYALRGALSERLMRAAAARAMAADPLGAFEDGIHVALCGAGSPLPDPQRSGPCVGVVAGGQLFVVDSGSAASRGLQRVGMPPGRIAAVLLTHFHSDHIDGLGEVALQHWVGGTHTAPLVLIGPTGLEEVASGFERAYRLDSVYRIAHHGEAVAPPGGFGFEPRPFETPAVGSEQVVWNDGGVSIRAFRVQHEPVEPAVGYRIDYAGRSVVISGDTKKCAEVERVAQGVDLLVHEALAPQLVAIITDAARQAGRSPLAKITSDILDYHTTPVEAAEIAQAAGAGYLLFDHIVPPLLVPGMEAAFVEGVSDAYDGGFAVGRDGTMISLPAGSDAIVVH